MDLTANILTFAPFKEALWPEWKLVRVEAFSRGLSFANLSVVLNVMCVSWTIVNWRRPFLSAAVPADCEGRDEKVRGLGTTRWILLIVNNVLFLPTKMWVGGEGGTY